MRHACCNIQIQFINQYFQNLYIFILLKWRILQHTNYVLLYHYSIYINLFIIPPLKNTLTQQQITKVCSDITCDKRPFIQSPEDPQLFHNDHLSKIIDVEAFTSQFCEEMSRLANQNIVLYQEFMYNRFLIQNFIYFFKSLFIYQKYIIIQLQNKENISLLQILEQGEAHLQKIDEMVIRQKTELAIDITNLQEKIMVVIQSIKEENMKRLDSFNEQYKQSFNIENNNFYDYYF